MARRIAAGVIDSVPVLLFVYWLVLDRELTFYFHGKCWLCPRPSYSPWLLHCKDCYKRQGGR